MPTAQQLLRFLRKLGYRTERQTGPHMILKHPTRRMLVVPFHRGEYSARAVTSHSEGCGSHRSGVPKQLERQRNGFGVNRPGAGDRTAVPTALLDIDFHSIEETGLSFVNALPKPIHARKVFAISVESAVFTLNRDGIRVQLHTSMLACRTVVGSNANQFRLRLRVRRSLQKLARAGASQEFVVLHDNEAAGQHEELGERSNPQAPL